MIITQPKAVITVSGRQFNVWRFLLEESLWVVVAVNVYFCEGIMCRWFLYSFMYPHLQPRQ